MGVKKNDESLESKNLLKTNISAINYKHSKTDGIELSEINMKDRT